MSKLEQVMQALQAAGIGIPDQPQTNGSRRKTAKSNGATAVDPKELLKAAPRQAATAGVPDDAPSCSVGGKTYRVYAASIQGDNGAFVAVKIDGMPFKKNTWSMSELRNIASDDFHMMLQEFIAEVDG
jgi:hypothetical protein